VQPWSRTIYDAYPDVVGIYYDVNRFEVGPIVALYERAEGALPASAEAEFPLTHPPLWDLLGESLRELGLNPPPSDFLYLAEV
jgi:hypothetical protein